MLRRTGFKKKQYEPAPAAPLSQLLRPVNVARVTAVFRTVPKTVEYRNPHLLTLARGMPCLLRVPDVCMGNTETTVACHSNLGVHGKAGARKADDHYSVWGCMACHRWLDQDKRPSYEEKAATFMAAHARQVLQWRKIAADPGRARRDRDAVQWALQLLSTTAEVSLTVPDQVEISVQEIDE